MQPFGLLSAAVGAFCAAAIGDWDLVFDGRKVRSFVALVGRGTMRAVYLVIGVAMVAVGLLSVFGVIGATHAHR